MSTGGLSLRLVVHDDETAQELRRLDEHRGTGTPITIIVAADAAGEAVAVSYTHLDVYKRQVRDLAARGVPGPFAPTEDVAWRGGLVTGAVHDENAWALTGDGGSGHAGLFGTADAVLTFGCAVLDALDRRSGPFGGHDLGWLVRARPGGTLRAGFDGKNLEGSSAGTRMGANSFGHLGFTGTSLWIDPDARIVVTLLTNRVNPTRDHVAIREARPWVHDLLWERAYEITGSSP